MSYMHITYGGSKQTIYLSDGKSALLDRYINLDTGGMYYTMGRQIAGKPINPNGVIGKKITKIAKDIMAASSPAIACNTDLTKLQWEGWDYKKILADRQRDTEIMFWGYLMAFCSLVGYWIIVTSWEMRLCIGIVILCTWLAWRTIMSTAVKKEGNKAYGE